MTGILFGAILVLIGDFISGKLVEKIRLPALLGMMISTCLRVWVPGGAF